MELLKDMYKTRNTMERYLCELFSILARNALMNDNHIAQSYCGQIRISFVVSVLIIEATRRAAPRVTVTPHCAAISIAVCI